MKNIIPILLAGSLAAGCVSAAKKVNTIQQDYETVNFEDGISLEEAIIIARKDVSEKALPNTYMIDKPRVVTEFESVPHHEEYWFVSFPESKSGGTPLVYMVALRKDTGKIVLSRSYSPINEWVLEAVLLKLHERRQ